MEAVAAKIAVKAAATKATAAATASAATAGTSVAATGGLVSSSAIASAGTLGAKTTLTLGNIGVASGGGLLGSLGSSLLTGLQVVGAVDAVVSPFMVGQRAADIADINAAQTNLDIQQ